MCAVVRRQTASRSKRFLPMTVVVSLPQVNRIDVHFNMWPLTEVTLKVRASPFSLPVVSCRDRVFLSNSLC